MDNSYTLVDHLKELRLRLIHAAGFFILSFVVLWVFRNDLLNIYLLLLKDIVHQVQGEIVLLRITDKFFIHLKTCFFFSLMLSIPYICYQVWLFVVPGLYKKEKKAISFFILLVMFLFYLGCMVAYYLVIPFGFKFLVNYSVQSSGILTDMAVKSQLAISLSEQVSLTQRFFLAFGIVFQTPAIMLVLVKIGITSVEQLRKFRKEIIVICFIFAAILTPPDPITMLGLGIPLVALFELGLILCRTLSRSNCDVN